MEASVEDLCDRLMATELEEEAFYIEPSSIGSVVDRGKHCLVSKLQSSKYYSREAFKATMRKVWKLGKPIRFFELGGPYAN